MSHILSRSIVVSALLILTAGCGGNSGPSGPTPLTAAQKAEVSATLTSATRPVYAAQDVSGSSLPNPVAAFLAPYSTGSLSAPQTGARQQMSQSLSNPSDCQVTQQGLEQFQNLQPSQAFNLQGSLSVSGVECPASLQMTVQAVNDLSVPTVETFSGSLNATYQVNTQDAAFEQLNDVDAFKVSLSGNGTASANSASGQGTLSASFHSQQYGNITINGSGTISGSANQFQATATVTLTYPGFNAVIDMTSSGTKGGAITTQYTLNGEPVSADQIQQLLTSAQE